MAGQIIFLILLIAATTWFWLNVRKIIRNIKLGRDVNRSDQPAKRWATMLKIAFGQTKMTKRPVAAVMHFFVYAGFIIINIEVLEIIIDGIFGTHRIFARPLGNLYNVLIAVFEVLALLVIVGVLVFYARRNLLKLKRFKGVEMTRWPLDDANYILIIETLLMIAFLTMNAADFKLQQSGTIPYIQAGFFPVSGPLSLLLPNAESALITIERFCWWFHIIGILAFLNYLPYSKHFHIILAFPNTYYSNLHPKGKFANMAAVTNEVKAMLDPAYTPEATAENTRFGAKDVTDLTWKNLMDAYSCTECGRCTAVCPANITGKLLSPRKIMMDTRDRLTEVGNNLDKKENDHQNGKALLDDYITREEIWACTTCNACTEACPINIDPLAIIMELRQYAVMEESKASTSINTMFGNTENNGAPWKCPAADRFNWATNN